MLAVVSATFLHSRQTRLKSNQEDGRPRLYRADLADATEAKVRMVPRTSGGN